MMMRSTPPRSANLAEMPVPAPAPMMGRPAVTCARRRRTHSSYPRKGMSGFFLRSADDAQQLIDERLREAGIIDVRIDLDDAYARAGVVAQCSKERLVRLRVVERLALRVDHADSAQRQHEDDRAARGVELRGNAATDLGALRGGRTHQRDGRVVTVESAPVELFRHGIDCA